MRRFKNTQLLTRGTGPTDVEDLYRPMDSTPDELILLRGFDARPTRFRDRYNAVFTRTQHEVIVSVKPVLDAVENYAKCVLA